MSMEHEQNSEMSLYKKVSVKVKSLVDFLHSKYGFSNEMIWKAIRKYANYKINEDKE